MKVQSNSPFDIALQANPHATTDSPASGRSIQNQESPPPASLNQQPKRKRSIDSKVAAELVNSQGASLRFKTDDASGVRVIEVVDRESGDVVYQIPSKQVVDFLRYLKDNKGNFVSRRL